MITPHDGENPPVIAALARRLRQQNPPVIARIIDGRVALDPRTVMPEEDEALIAAVKAALAS